MSTTLAAIKTQCILQQIIPPPYHANQARQGLRISPLYPKNPHKLFRILSKSIIYFWNLPCTILRLAWLFYNWKTYTKHEMQEAIFYGVFLCIILVFIPADHLQQTNFKLLTNLLNQTFKIVHIENLKNEQRARRKITPLIHLNEICVYGFSACFVILGPAYFAAPFVIHYLPIQLLFGKHLLSMICEACTHGFAVTYGAFTVLYVNLFTIVFLDNFIYYTKSFIPKVKYGRLKFEKYFERFRTFQILLQPFTLVYINFLTALIFVGIFLASGCACITIRMYGEMNLLTYILFPSLTMICVVDAIVLTYLANIPYQHYQRFKSWWKLILTRKEDKRLLKACQPTGFTLGPYGLCTAALGLRICDDYIHNTVTILLLGFL